MKWHQRTSTIYFTAKEIERFFRDAKDKELEEEITNKGLSWEEVGESKELQHKLANAIGQKIRTDKDEFEFFLAADIFIHHFREGSEIGFILKDSYNPETRQISNLQTLKEAIKENCMTDFSVLEDNEIRHFQLKRYTGTLTTGSFFDFLGKKIRHYCNNLKGTHLLVLLQPGTSDTINIDFDEINRRLIELLPNKEGQILATYNQDNKFNVLRRVYPEISNTRKPLKYSFDTPKPL